MGKIMRFASETYVQSEVGTRLKTLEPQESDIPKVFINGAIPTTKDDVNAELTYISKTLTFRSYITIKC
jgi:hypothetical protein